MAARGIEGIKRSSDVATRGMSMLATSLGTVGGKFGDAASQVTNFVFSVKQLGAAAMGW